MRWRKVKPVIGDERVVSEFLFFPKTLDKETRWLEFAEIRQMYWGRPWTKGSWEDVGWHNGERNPR